MVRETKICTCHGQPSPPDAAAEPVCHGACALQRRIPCAANETQCSQKQKKYLKLKKKKKPFKKWHEFTGVSLMRPSGSSFLAANVLDFLPWPPPPQLPAHRLTPLGLGGPSFGDSSTRLPKYAEHLSMSSAHQPHTWNFWLIPPLLDLDEIHSEGEALAFPVATERASLHSLEVWRGVTSPWGRL